MVDTFQLSSDAFYYLKDGEQPILDDNLEEAFAIEALFPEGFVIINFKVLDNTGFIEATIGPKRIITKHSRARVKPAAKIPIDYNDDDKTKEELSKYYDSDETYRIFKTTRIELVWLDEIKSKVRVFMHSLVSGRRKLFGEFQIGITNNGLKYFQKDNDDGTFTRLYLNKFVTVQK